MKKLILTAATVLAFGFANSQEQTSKGKLLVEVNTGFGNGVGNTSINFRSKDGDTEYSFGAEGGYFLANNLALKVGLGYGGSSQSIPNPLGSGTIDVTTSSIGYKVGAKYYISSMIPVEVSYNGLSIENATNNPSWLGLQAGYAVFLGDMVSLEPGLRYNYALLSKEDGGFSDLQFNIGFVMHF